MSALSDFAENKLADHAIGTATYTPGATLTVKLYTVAPSDSGGGTEVTGGSYAAVALTNNTVNFPQCPTSGTPTKTNGSVIQFPVATASWGTVTHWAIYEGANLLTYGAISPNNYVSAGDAPKIDAGKLIIEFLSAAGGGLTESVRRKLLDMMFGAVTYTKPTTVYVSAATGISGETLYDWVDAGYARKAITFGAASGGVATSTNAQTINSSVVDSGSSDVLTHYGIWDDLVSGSLIAVGALSTPRTPAMSDLVRFNTGEIVLTLQ